MVIEDRRVKRETTYGELDNLTTFRFLNEYNPFSGKLCLKVRNHFVVLENGSVLEQSHYRQQDRVEILNSKLIIE